MVHQVVEALMQVYISWSGKISYRIAQLLRDLIRSIFPDLEPWVSAEDIEEGARWSPDLLKILDQADFSIICVDPSNFLSHWLHFEAGAITKSIKKWNIKVFLYELTQGELKGSLGLFQTVRIDKAEIRRMLEDIHANYIQVPISQMEVVAHLEDAWPEFRDEIAKINKDPTPTKTQKEDTPGKEFDPKQVYLDEIDEKLLALLCVNEGIEDERIATTVYLPRGTCLQHLIEMENKELVWSNLSFGVRRWYITNFGKKFLPAFYQDLGNLNP